MGSLATPSSRGGGGMPVPPHAQRCHLILQRSLAIQLSKPGAVPEQFWMYDSGYMLFQSFLSANAQCWWNAPLVAASRTLRYAGHVAPGFLLVTADACALEVLRSAYARSVLKPPASYVICGMGDIEDCIVTPVSQGQFTPLPEALCDVIMELTTTGQSASLELIRRGLGQRFPAMQAPSPEIIYDSLAQLTQERKIYQTSRGYFIVTPERRRSRSHSRSKSLGRSAVDTGPQESRTILMTHSEAIHSLYGEITTMRDGDVTHQCIQTNLADVICGGNPNDKIMYARGHNSNKSRSGSFPCSPRSLERRHSLRLFGSSKRLQRFASTRSLGKVYHHNASQCNTTDSSSSEYHSTDSTSPKKASLLSRLFRRSGRNNKSRAQIKTFSAQFPPTEWFNSKAIHLHCVATQTNDHETASDSLQMSQSTFYDGSEYSQRSSTLPRRHRRNLSNESTIIISSRDHSPIRRKSPMCYSGSLPRSTHSIANSHKSGSKQNEERKMADKIRKEKLDENKARIINNGPSSLDSGKTSKCDSEITSGPSSLESSRISSTRGILESQYGSNSGHSSLESHTSTNTTIASPSHLDKISKMHRKSPKCSPKRFADTKTAIEHQNKLASCTSNPKSKLLDSKITTARVPNSNSNSSITLQVTTNTTNQNCNAGNTKIFVQNSPVRSVITFENDKLTENSNVYIINNETKNGERSQTFQKHFASAVPVSDKISGTEIREYKESERNVINNEVHNEPVIALDQSKFTKNINNDATMNNSRKLSLQLPNNASNGSLSYKNVLKNVSTSQGSNPVSPVINKNVLSFENATVLPNSQPSSPNKSYDNITGSAGNLRYDKNTLVSDFNHKLTQNNKLNSNCDLKNSHLCFESGANLMKKPPLNSNPNIAQCINTISSDSVANILAKTVMEHKNIIAVASEPNLSYKIQDGGGTKPKIESKINGIDSDRRFSLTRENSSENQEMYNFPSLSDLSFNFTSLAAQKILKGVSINSVDTLVELNMAALGAEKQNNCEVGTVCTDFGLV